LPAALARPPALMNVWLLYCAARARGAIWSSPARGSARPPLREVIQQAGKGPW